MNIVTGEKLQLLCDSFIGSNSDFRFNPTIIKYPERFLLIDNSFEKIDNKQVIFCYSHILADIEKLISLLRKFLNRFVLVFHNSDHNFTEKSLILFDAIPLLRHIYTQNMDVKDDRVTPLPIGIANSMWPHGNLPLLQKIISQNTPKTKDIFFNFNIHTNYSVRNECYTQIISKNIPFLRNFGNQQTYLQELASYKYAICPEGNGIDCHRFWECLYLRVVPICKRNILITHYAQYFPIIIVDSWGQVDTVALQKHYPSIEWKKLELLDINYYSELFAGMRIQCGS